MDQLNGFWIMGIAVNVILTVLALIWVFRSMRPPPSPPEDSNTSSHRPPD